MFFRRACPIRALHIQIALTLSMASASRCVTPFRPLPLIESTRSPFWILPSRSATLPFITLWICPIKKKESDYSIASRLSIQSSRFFSFKLNLNFETKTEK